MHRVSRSTHILLAQAGIQSTPFHSLTDFFTDFVTDLLIYSCTRSRTPHSLARSFILLFISLYVIALRSIPFRCSFFLLYLHPQQYVPSAQILGNRPAIWETHGNTSYMI